MTAEELFEWLAGADIDADNPVQLMDDTGRRYTLEHPVVTTDDDGTRVVVLGAGQAVSR